MFREYGLCIAQKHFLILVEACARFTVFQFEWRYFSRTDLNFQKPFNKNIKICHTQCPVWSSSSLHFGHSNECLPGDSRQHGFSTIHQCVSTWRMQSSHLWLQTACEPQPPAGANVPWPQPLGGTNQWPEKDNSIYNMSKTITSHSNL